MIEEYIKRVNGQGVPGAEIIAEIEKLRAKYEKKGK
jgi:hypothetical protein